MHARVAWSQCLAPGESCDAGGVVAAAAVAQASLAPDVQIVRVQLDGSAALACTQSEVSLPNQSCSTRHLLRQQVTQARWSL